jgi:hypothetical protein
MAEPDKLNVETAHHAGHVLRVWHDRETRWFYDVDDTNPQSVNFLFETGFDFQKQRARAKDLAHDFMHHLTPTTVCQEQLNWKPDPSTKADVLGEKL